MMRNIKLTVAYVGTNYHGFQKQPCGETVQDVLEEFLTRVCGEPVQVVGSGRTDAGVHAEGQVVSFKTNGTIPVGNILRAALSLLPPDIAILKAEEVDEDFHARFSAKSKEYHYIISEKNAPDPFNYDRKWFVKETLDWQLMGLAAEKLLGQHDFFNFCSSGSDVTSTVRTVTKAEFLQKDGDTIFVIAADGFLYHMVRKLVWALAEVGTGRWSVEKFVACVENPQLRPDVALAPAGGLYLYKVVY